MFKVVADQLKVAQGWVRCGHCGEVFDASVQLLPGEAAMLGGLTLTPDEVPGLERTPLLESAKNAEPAPIPPDDLELTETPADALAGVLPRTPEPPAQDEATQPAEPEPGRADGQCLRKFQQQEVEGLPLSAVPVDELPVDHLAMAALPPVEATPDAAPSMDARPLDAPPEHLALEPPAPAADDSDSSSLNLTHAEALNVRMLQPEMPGSETAEPEATSEVSFVRDARRKAFWKKPLTRVAMGLLLLVLLSALALQWMVQQKDTLAALEPRLVPLLQALCSPMECEIRPLRRIGSLAIDSSSFSKTGPDTYRLSFVLKNTDTTSLEIPAVEVTLTDSQDQTLMRRVLTPGQFGAAAITLGAHLELSGAVSLKVSGEDPRGASLSQAAFLPVTGYRILAFYP